MDVGTLGQLLAIGLLAAAVAVGLRLWRRQAPPPLPRILQVPSEFPSIQAAIAAASPGDTVVVAPGVYRENLDFLGKGITVTSRHPQDAAVVAATIIDGGEQGSVVTFDSYEPPGAVLCGFTITNGSGKLQSSLNVLGSSARAGGGIRIGSESGPVIRNNLITKNRADLGGGVYACSISLALLEDNCIADNHALLGGGVRVAGDFRKPRTRDSGQQTPFRLRQCTVRHNRASIGAGVSIDRVSSPQIIDNTIHHNIAAWDGGGIAVWDRSSPEIRGNRIFDNQAGSVYGYGGGISIVNTCRPSITGNFITGNQATGTVESGGGGVMAYRSAPSMADNVLQDNQAQNGPALYLWGSGQADVDEEEMEPATVTERVPAARLKA
jgi:nitrous oxidase accessory protein NosD